MANVSYVCEFQFVVCLSPITTKLDVDCTMRGVCCCMTDEYRVTESKRCRMYCLNQHHISRPDQK